ncbi:MAG: RNA polymerase sigma factor [Anaerolineae bacterium]|nr:RNA polymerase sigma factor [Anaerolineae bacterium]MCI0610096.1 RNA polymerase sigma factor [Anaerolineae bacterium]
MTVETSLLQSLRDGDVDAFTWLVEQYHTSLVRLARIYVHNTVIAEELAQETWLAVLQGLDRFEGRSSLKTWIFSILTNKAKTRSQRENRSVSYTDLEESLHASHEPTVDPSRFNSPAAERLPNHWAVNPVSWEGIPEEILLSQETMNLVRQAINELPEHQRTVITLRDMNELSSQEICNILGISETNQRVLLHRARASVRQTLEEHLQPET